MEYCECTNPELSCQGGRVVCWTCGKEQAPCVHDDIDDSTGICRDCHEKVLLKEGEK